jgi:hypothetical protein
MIITIYLLIFITIVVFYLSFKKSRCLLFGFPGYSFLISLIFFGFTFEDLSKGIAFGYNNLNFLVLYAYLFHIIIVPWIIIIEYKISIKNLFFIKIKNNNILKIIALSTSILMIYIFITQNTLEYILSLGPMAGVEQRLLITHGLNENSPVYLRYWRLVREIQIFSVLFLITNTEKFKVKRLEYLFYLMSLILMLFISMEKVIFLQIFLFYGIKRAVQGKVVILYPLIGFIILFIIYKVTFDDFPIQDFLQIILARIEEQTSSAYLHMMFVDSFGYLGFQGLPLGFFGRLLGVEYLDLSKYSYAILHPEYASLGLFGSSGGLGMVTIEAIYPKIGVIFYILLTIFVGYISILISKISDNGIRGFLSAYWAVFYVFPFIFSPFSLIHPIFILSIPLWIHIMILLSVIKFRNKYICK